MRTTAVGNVVVGVDGSRCSLRAVAAAAMEAERRRVPLRLVYAVHPDDDPGRIDAIIAGAARVARYSTTGRSGLVITVTLTDQPPADALLGEAREASVLVLGEGGAPDKLGPVASQVHREAEGPVVLVPLTTGRAG
ncbi:universal stress protein [Pseudonocardia acidicola]|uniref:Universal stress protein n=1 Tax=Pseudonocardia acidicola TaxID=2724939 RepID=A0ABX1S9N5_9PSEU|nr:universal stress protein [Pseudonocardia acidicola]NMH97619.1 universal stress protein [Pseudonocardia acidicola]